jgi:hypothetical protein
MKHEIAGELRQYQAELKYAWDKLWPSLLSAATGSANLQTHGARSPRTFAGSWGHPFCRVMGPPAGGVT